MNQNETHSNGEMTALQIVRLPRLKAMTGLSKTTLYELIRKGAIPKPIKLGARAVGWLQSDIESFISSRVIASRSE